MKPTTTVFSHTPPINEIGAATPNPPDIEQINAAIDRQLKVVLERLKVAPDYFDKRQLASRLGISVRTIDNLMKRGLPHFKITSKIVRFPRGAVDEWLAERMVSACSRSVRARRYRLR